jgi:SPP1 gp7 family putative phage head morphogenesis protein
MACLMFMSLLGNIRQKVDNAVFSYSGVKVGENQMRPIGFGKAVGETKNAVYKALIPTWLVNPPFGYPIGKNIPEVRRLARTPYISMVTNMAVNEIASLDWDVSVKDGMSVPEGVVQMTKDFLYNPNCNDESLGDLLRPYVRDIIEIDAGVLVKVKNLKGEFVELYARDGGLFTKNPDRYGVMPEENAFYQYGWYSNAQPIPFRFDDVVYTMMYPLSDSIYGMSNIEVLDEVLQMLIYGVSSNLDYYADNNIPKGVMSLIGANTDDVKAFSDNFREAQKKRDGVGKWWKNLWTMPVINVEGKFERIGFSNIELQQLEQQQFFAKLCFAVFNVNPSELGFTEDSNKATATVQSTVFKRKFLKPLINLIEYKFNTQIVNDLPWIKGKYENCLDFSFIEFDVQQEKAKRELLWGDLDKRVKTVNEVREELGLKPIKFGDSIGDQSGFGFQSTSNTGFNAFDEKDRMADKEAVDVSVKSFRDTTRVIKKKVGLKALSSVSPLGLKEFEQEYKKVLKNFEDIVLKEVEVYSGGKIELKALDSNVIKKILDSIDFSVLGNSVRGLLKNGFFKGLEKSEKELNMNFVVDDKTLNFLSEYTFDNVKGLEDEAKGKLRQVLQRGVMDGKGVRDVKKDLREVFDMADNRLEMIARTELNRASNEGALSGYKQSGLKGKKKWLATIDNRTCPVCKRLNGKVVGLDEKWVDNVTGQSFNIALAHPNCRCTQTFEVD